ncbi:MAG: glutathione S-transferase [Burkholderiaceae bacterium]|nr:glutathione S-transferase [Burkholderiaceae bacterium]
MNLPVLYSFRRCPYAMRARLALRVAGVPYELREVALKAKPAAMLALSPKGTVPVLQLPDGSVLEESLHVMAWALAQSDPDGWLAQGSPQEAQALIERNDGPFKHLLDRYKYANRHPEFTARQYRQQAVDLHIAPLSARLAATRYLLGAGPSLADAAIFPFVRQFAGVDEAWFAQAPFPALRAWLNEWLASPLFRDIMEKTLPWKETPGGRESS